MYVSADQHISVLLYGYIIKQKTHLNNSNERHMAMTRNICWQYRQYVIIMTAIIKTSIMHNIYKMTINSHTEMIHQFMYKVEEFCETNDIHYQSTKTDIIG